MCLLASCNDSIISSGSYGWWSAYLAGGSVVYDATFPRPDTRIGKKIKEVFYSSGWIALLKIILNEIHINKNKIT